jgi:hypothetical protein
MFLLGLGVALLCGILISLSYFLRNEKRSKSLGISLLVFPMVTMSVVMMIHLNATLGVAIAISGAFTLVRFRTVPGSALDITHVFLSVTAGLSVGLGQAIFAGAVTAAVVFVLVIVRLVPATAYQKTADTLKISATQTKQILSITVPDDVDYMRDFEPILEKFTTSHVIVETATTQMGSLYKLKYEIKINSQNAVGELIGELRAKNSNLPISCVVVRATDSREL